ncbi:TPA: type I toxin-antitoxin system Fst family toxin [Streptococcus suis]|nr:type I toxin-antitoxin system Fst family toxin [Streptococcus suis]NQK41965.1 type I toxin-antitoxin system Fst family toxin [Streptococcus suis]NRG68258.1 type I toxin-antitoxin system Fst family toxin [Streptococcus suis]HEM2831047.1 type I toxin-antitoxin system Fst family toxin [Streptococcus suis]HEM4802749.1 type I toxin-antitoxin system Fst family toxin [Streptococcus suis]
MFELFFSTIIGPLVVGLVLLLVQKWLDKD